MEEEARVLFAAAELGRADIIGKAIESLTAGDFCLVVRQRNREIVLVFERQCVERSEITHYKRKAGPGKRVPEPYETDVVTTRLMCTRCVASLAEDVA